MVVIIANIQKVNSLKYVEVAKKVLEKFDRSYNVIVDFPFKVEDRKLISQAEFLVSIGGDGTILSVLSYSETRKLPILPVNSGTLGFISSVKAGQLKKLLSAYLKGLVGSSSNDFIIDKRRSIQITFNNRNYFAFNDAVIAKGNQGKLMTTDVSINDIPTVSFRSDGLIVCTATGSTAYNLASGGPILHPSIPAMILNPICPHSLTLKPIVVPGDEVIEIKAFHRDENFPVFLNLDGIKQKKITSGTAIKFTLHRDLIKFIKPRDEHYFTVLKEKMYWGV